MEVVEETSDLVLVEEENRILKKQQITVEEAVEEANDLEPAEEENRKTEMRQINLMGQVAEAVEVDGLEEEEREATLEEEIVITIEITTKMEEVEEAEAEGLETTSKGEVEVDEGHLTQTVQMFPLHRQSS